MSLHDVYWVTHYVLVSLKRDKQELVSESCLPGFVTLYYSGRRFSESSRLEIALFKTLSNAELASYPPTVMSPLRKPSSTDWRQLELPLVSETVLPDTGYRTSRSIARQSLRTFVITLVLVATAVLFLYDRVPAQGPYYWLSEKIPVSSSTRNPAFLVKASHGAVASEAEVCSQIGVDTLKDGGNAVDAAISTTLCIGVVNMFSYVISGNPYPALLITNPARESAAEAS